MSGLHSIVSGSGLHITVSKHITKLTEGIYPVSHWRVAVDPANLLVNEKAPWVGLVKLGHSPKKVYYS